MPKETSYCPLCGGNGCNACGETGEVETGGLVDQVWHEDEETDDATGDQGPGIDSGREELQEEEQPTVDESDLFDESGEQIDRPWEEPDPDPITDEEADRIQYGVGEQRDE